MSYRITLGFAADWAEFCVPRDGDDLQDVAARAYAEDAKVIAMDADWAARFVAAGKEFIGQDLTRLVHRDLGIPDEVKTDAVVVVAGAEVVHRLHVSIRTSKLVVPHADGGQTIYMDSGRRLSTGERVFE